MKRLNWAVEAKFNPWPRNQSEVRLLTLFEDN
jgi:hypothetical protein